MSKIKNDGLDQRWKSVKP